MTKSTITRERIQRIIRAIDSEAYDEEEIREWLSSDEIMELARMALAAMDSAPVELPFDYLQGHKDGLEWAAQLAEANHPQTGDWLYDDPVDLAKAIRKGPDIPELKSVQADADDNFYSWFGRFWFENYQQNNYTTSAKQMLGTMAEFAFRAGRESATQVSNSPVIPDGSASMLRRWLAFGRGMQNAGSQLPHNLIAETESMLAAAQHDTPALNSVQSVVTVPGKWIPVIERMPEDEQEVLTINKMGHRFVSFFDKHSGLFFDGLDAPAACCIEHALVTHWMPLPAAPQEVKGE
ncbi:TPA: DUF551 domain-containing protein [Klebsiella pneumoniae]|nr:DUF551 domain-containing protein [Klebsiella pneumoniae]HDE2612789.1 DUF551 domain-containing protein [Klebsiella pneumoniae]